MAANQYIVIPALNSNTGDGASEGSAFGDLQYAYDTAPRNSDGTIFHVKSGAAEVLAAPLNPLGNASTPVITRGYTNTPGDAGIAEIDCNGFTASSGGDGQGWYNLELHNGPPAAKLLDLTQYSVAVNLRIHDGEGGGLGLTATRCLAVGCGIWDVGSALYDGVLLGGRGNRLIGCYVANSAGRKMRHAVHVAHEYCVVDGTLISVDGATNGIYKTTNYFSFLANNNSILSAGGSGTGIYIPIGNSNVALSLVNNYVEGFITGKGFDVATVEHQGIACANKGFNNLNTIASGIASNTLFSDGSNEDLAGSGLAKLGADSFDNRFEFFAPTALIQSAGYPQKDF